MPRGVLKTAALAATAAFALTAPAAAETISVKRAVKRDCLTSAAGKPGVATTSYTADRTGLLTARLAGRRGDWDLAIFSERGARLGGSAAFGRREFAPALVEAGDTVTLQACRRSGRARRATVTTDFVELFEHQLEQRISLVRIPFATRAVVPLLEAAGIDVTHNAHDGMIDVLLYGDGDRTTLGKLGLPHTTLIEDMLAHEAAEREKDRAYKRAMAQEGSPLPSGRADYRMPEDYPNELKQIAERYPQLVRRVELKEKSFQGRDLGAIEIAADVANDKGRPTFILNALHHAREWPAAEGAIEFAWLLVQGYGKDDRITKLLDTTRVIVMPQTNPDGFQVSRSAPNPDPDGEQGVGTVYSTATGVVILGGSLGYKRKNCNPGTGSDPGTPCEFAIGVDPNRNYGESWGGPGASTNPNDQSYRGTGPFSEPEPRAVKELVSSTNANGLLTIHNVAALVLRPPGLEADGLAPDEAYLEALGAKMAAATGYENQYGWQLYDTTGTTDDWSYAATGHYGYTVEMGPSDGNFHGNYEEHVVKQWTGDDDVAVGGLREAYLTAAEAARDASFQGRITGRAPAGRTLRITKEFKTESFPVCPVSDPVPLNGAPDTCSAETTTGDVIVQDEKLDFTTTVPANGRYEWWVNPSTRPFEAREGKVEKYTLTCEDGGAVKETVEVAISRGERKAIDLPCGGTLGADNPNAGITVKVKRLKARKGGRRAAVRVQVLGGTLRKARVLVRRGKKVIGVKRVKALKGTKTVRVKVRGKKLRRKGRYKVVVKAKGLRVTKGLRSR